MTLSSRFDIKDLWQFKREIIIMLAEAWDVWRLDMSWLNMIILTHDVFSRQWEVKLWENIIVGRDIAAGDVGSWCVMVAGPWTTIGLGLNIWSGSKRDSILRVIVDVSRPAGVRNFILLGRRIRIVSRRRRCDRGSDAIAAHDFTFPPRWLIMFGTLDFHPSNQIEAIDASPNEVRVCPCINARQTLEAPKIELASLWREDNATCNQVDEIRYLVELFNRE